MDRVGIRELKQNPHQVIQRVLATGDDVELTNYGKPTGVRIVADRTTPRRWVSAAELADLAPLDPGVSTRWKADLDGLAGTAEDPWENR